MSPASVSAMTKNERSGRTFTSVSRERGTLTPKSTVNATSATVSTATCGDYDGELVVAGPDLRLGDLWALLAKPRLGWLAAHCLKRRRPPGPMSWRGQNRRRLLSPPNPCV
jgi:hypothetical protein